MVEASPVGFVVGAFCENGGRLLKKLSKWKEASLALLLEMVVVRPVANE